MISSEGLNGAPRFVVSPMLRALRRVREPAFAGRTAQALGAVAGYGAALVLTIALVALRYRGVDPAVVTASSGMYAFGDLLLGLFLFALLSIPSTVVLIRLLRGSDLFWSLFSWACLLWGGGLSPLLAAVLWAPAVLTDPGATMGNPFLILHLLSILNCFALPGILLVTVAAWAVCRDRPTVRRRLLRASALEALSLVVVGAWWAVALYTSAHP